MNTTNDKFTTCPICGSNTVKENQDAISSKICITCGYTTSTEYSLDNEDKLNGKTAKLIEDLRKKDFVLKQFWYPAVIHSTGKGMIFPDGKDTLTWRWAVAKEVPIPPFERVNYPIKNKPGYFYESRLDTESIKHYEKTEFYKALIDLGLDVDKLYN